MSGHKPEIDFFRSVSSFKAKNYFRFHKLIYSDSNSPEIVDLLRGFKSRCGRLGISPDRLLKDWVNLQYSILFSAEDSKLPSAYWQLFDDSLDIKIVSTVPPGLPRESHERWRKAFCQGSILDHQVYLVPEPEALFLSWAFDHKDTIDFKVYLRNANGSPDYRLHISIEGRHIRCA